MQGWRTPLTEEAREFPNHVVGVLADRGYPEPEHITEVLKTAPPDTVFVVRYANKEDMQLLQAVMAAGIEPVLSKGSPPYWKGVEGWRDGELLNTCSKVLVFRDGSKDTKADWSKLADDPTYSKVWPGLIVFTKGKKKRKQRKGRKVE